MTATTDKDRCIKVLTAIAPLHNLHRVGMYEDHQGISPCGTGIMVKLRPHVSSLATWDTDGLTRLVVAAHEHRCRVEIRPSMDYLVVTVHPRQADGNLYERHPGVDALTASETPR